jgi:hypothetical protein
MRQPFQTTRGKPAEARLFPPENNDNSGAVSC